MAENHNMLNETTSLSFSKLCIYYLYIMTIYLSFETPILNLLPHFMLAPVRYGIEAFGYVLLIFLFIAQWGHYKYGNQEILIFLAILVMALNVIFYVSDLKIAAMGFRWLLRYLYLYFIVIFINWTPFYIKRFFRLITWIIRIEMVLSILQLVAKDFVNQLLAPYYQDIISGISSYATQGSASNAIFGSFGRYSEFGMFIMLALWFYISGYAASEKKEHRQQYFYRILLWGILLILSYCRQALVAVLFSVLIFALAYKEWKMTRSSMVLMGILIVAAIPVSILLLSSFEATYGTIYEGLASRFLSIFSLKYLTMDYTGKGRTWFYTHALYRLVSTRPLLGYGLGRYGCQTAIQYDTSVYEALDIPTRFSMDGYYVSIIGQLGLVGGGFLISIYLYFARSCRKYFNSLKKDLYTKRIMIFTYGYIICGLITAFFSSSLSDRYLAFYMWVLIGICRYCSANNLVLTDED